MTHRFYLRGLLLLVCLGLATILGFQPGYADSAGSATVAGVRELAQNGAELERSHKWLEAIEHYEHALKAWPDNKELEYGLRRSKIHFSVERRYTDQSFLKSLKSLPRTEALALFDEVLGKVQGAYVDTMSATSFVAHGTESLYLALDDQRFLNANAPGRVPADASVFRRRLRDEFWNKPIAYPDREGARAVVSQICDIARNELDLPAGPVVMEYVFGGCNALDDYSGFLTPTRLSDLYGNIEGQFVGLGIEMKAEAGKGLLLVNVLPDSPAAEGGLRNNEHIVTIDGTDCRNLSTDEAAGLLQGREGSQVSLEVSRVEGEEHRQLRLTRRAVVVKSIPIVRMIDRENGIGYIQMASFQKSSAEELDAALNQLRNQGMRALIWDVRGNPGGLLTAAVEVLDRFVDDGVLVSTRGRTIDQNMSYSAHRPGTWKVPLALLIDGDSASASEIVAGAVRDYKRGRIIGRKSYGKWSVQSIFPISRGTGLRLTTAKFYSPLGHTLGKIGVQPDIDVPHPDQHRVHFRGPTEIDVAGDEDIQSALGVLRRQVASR